MDCKIISRLFLIIIIFTTTQLNAIEFKGKFIQGHYIIGITDPSAKIIIDKKKVKVSDNGYFVFGIDRDRKFDLTVTKIIDGKKEKIIKKVLKRIYNTNFEKALNNALFITDKSLLSSNFVTPSFFAGLSQQCNCKLLRSKVCPPSNLGRSKVKLVDEGLTLL